jgi:hypothetical protein
MRKTFFFALCTLIAIGASAAQFHDFYVIPVAAHAPGANGTSWRTDVSIQNIQSTPVTVEFAIVESGEGILDNTFAVAVDASGASTVTVPAGGSMTLIDLLKNHRGRAETTGALLVGGDKAFAVTSRTYNATANGTLGQTVSAAGDIASDGSDAASTLFIPGLAQNASFRTNLGLVMSAAAMPLTVTVTINGASGSTLGTRTFNVAAGLTTHVQFPATSVAAAPFDTAGAVVRIIDGSGTVVSYASVVDNASGDASFISGGTANAGDVSPLLSVLKRTGQ